MKKRKRLNEINREKNERRKEVGEKLSERKRDGEGERERKRAVKIE